MHDWTLVEVRVDWIARMAELRLLDEHSMERSLLFNGLCELYIDGQEHWGRSSSINEASWCGGDGGEAISLKIEMQSGGMINISAKSCENDGARSQQGQWLIG